MNHEPADDTVAHDAWLREALRHAPDSEVAPPPALRETILRQARATAAPRRPLRVLETWWHWFTRPVVSAGFASLMVSAVLTLMWWSGGFEDEAAQTRPSSQVPAAPAAPAAQPSEPAQTADASAPTADAAAAAKREKAAPAKRPLRATQPQAPAPEAAAAPAAPLAERRADAPLAAQVPPPSRDAVARGEAAPATTASIAVDPLPHVMTGAALRWTLAGRSHPHGDAQQAWFDRLRSATAGRWQPAADAAGEGVRLQLFDGSELRGEFVLARDHVLWLGPRRAAWRAPLAEADAEQLESLARQW